MVEKTYYDILGVSTNAGEKRIKTAYRRLCLKTHPDLIQGGNKKQAEADFLKGQEAYNTLKDPEKRRLYDQYRSNPQGRAFSQGAPATGKYGTLREILSTLNGMQMPPPYRDFAGLDARFQKLMREMLLATDSFQETIVEIQKCIIGSIDLWWYIW